MSTLHCLRIQNTIVCGAAVLAAALLLIISLVKYGKGRHPWMDNFKWLALGSVALTIWPIVRKAWSALRVKVCVYAFAHVCVHLWM